MKLRAEQFIVVRIDGVIQSYWDTATEANEAAVQLGRIWPTFAFFVLAPPEREHGPSCGNCGSPIILYPWREGDLSFCDVECANDCAQKMLEDRVR